MSKVTPSARRRKSVAAGTVVGLAAVGAAVSAGQACADSGLPGLAAGGFPLSTNALTAVKGLVSHNPGQIMGMPIAGLPLLNEVPVVLDSAAPAAQSLPGMSGVDFGVPAAHAGVPAAVAHAPATRSRLAPGAARPTITPPGFPATPGPAVGSLPANVATTAGAPADFPAQPPMAPPPAAAEKAPKAKGPLESLPVVGGLAGNLPLLGGGSPLGGLPLSGLPGLGGLAG